MTAPVNKLRDGALCASIWKNQSEKGVFYSVTFERTYSDENEQPQNANSYSGSEILRLSRLADKSYDWILWRRVEDKAQAREPK